MWIKEIITRNVFVREKQYRVYSFSKCNVFLICSESSNAIFVFKVDVLCANC